MDVVDSNGFSVLHAAAAGSNAEVIREILSAGFDISDISAKDDNGETPLHVAAWNGKTEAALELISHGADKAIVADAVGTPLHQAALGGHVSTVSVLHAAAACGNVEVI